MYAVQRRTRTHEADKEHALTTHEVTRHLARLPLTTLSYARCGEGDPLIMVPATISEIDDWLPFVRFMGRRYRAHFFELPGHGESLPFDEPFTSDLVAETVEQLADHLGLDRFALMGFSFGGILTLKALRWLGDRVTEVALISPCVSHRGLLHSPARLAAVRAAAATMRSTVARDAALRLMGDPRSVDALVWFATAVGKYETSADLRSRFLDMPASTVDTFVNQVREILCVETEDLAGPFPQRCFFGMSVSDPLLDFDVSHRFVREQFADPIVERLDLPYHCPPEPFTLEQLDRDYARLLDAFDG